MSDGKNVLSLLGLALRGGRLEVGDEAAALSARGGVARLLLTASDAGAKTLRRAQFLAEEGHCLLLTAPFSKEELGRALGRGSAAIVAVTDLGLAAAAVEKLAILDPEGCGGAAERMQLKLRRAKERREAPRKRPPPEGRAETRRPRGGRPDRGKSEARTPQGGRPGKGKSEAWTPQGGRPGKGRPEARTPQGGRPGKGRPEARTPQGGRSDSRKGPPRSGTRGRGHGGGS